MQRETLKVQESNFNQLKLKMLLKFDKIKYLQDYFNSTRPNKKKVDLSIELNDQELTDLVMKNF